MARSRKAGDAKVAVAYLRASTDDQQLGLDTQRAAIEQWASSQGVRIAAFEADPGVSGGTPLEERAGLQRAIAHLRRFNAGLLLVAKLDRLARDVVIAAMVERAVAAEGARLFCVDGIGNGDEPADMLMRTMVGGVAQFERAIIRKRIKDALALKKTRLERVGGIPWGWRLSDDGKHLEPDEGELETARIMRQLADNGLQYRKIVRALAEAGRFNRRGRIFGIKQISNIIGGARSSRPRTPEPVAACGRGHTHPEGAEAVGQWCTDGECGLERGKPLPVRRIQWRAQPIARAS